MDLYMDDFVTYLKSEQTRINCSLDDNKIPIKRSVTGGNTFKIY